MRILYILLAVLVLLFVLAIGAAADAYSAPPVSSRATYTPLPEVTPAPTYAPPAYPGPEDRQRPQERPRATPVPARGLRCGNCP